MRVFCALVLLLSHLLNASAQNSLRNLEKIRIYGADYIRVQEWTDAIGFHARWLKRDEELRVTNQWWNFSFDADSRKARANGINLMLSLPVVLRNDVPFISFVDAQTTIHPIVFPAKYPVGKTIQTICLDPGHGGRDPGNTEKKNQEKKYTLLLAEEIAVLLRQANFKVVMTRARDQFVDLYDRAAIANRNGADLFISLHYNATSSPDVSGVEVYCLSPAGTSSSNSGGGKSEAGSFPGNGQNEKNMFLAYHLQKALLRNLAVEDRGIKRARFEVLREVKMPAVLIEGGFMSNRDEARRIYDSVNRKKMAQAVVDGIRAYKQKIETASAK